MTLDLLDKVLAETQIDLAPDNSDVGPITGLLFQHRKLGAVLWACCSRQAEAVNVSQEDFKAALDGDALSKGWGALVDAVAFFIQSRSPEMANAYRGEIEAALRVIEAGAKALVETIKSEETDEAMLGAASRIGADMQKELTKALGDFATS